jgi:hypothetical protein
MKRNILSIAAILILAVACKKNNSDEPVPPAPTASPAEGYWTGKYTTTGQLGFENYAMLIKPNGFVRIYDLGNTTDTGTLIIGAKVNGVWSMSGNTVQTTYQSGTKTVNTSATLNAAKTQMNGTWAFDAIGKGNIELTKQN